MAHLRSLTPIALPPGVTIRSPGEGELGQLFEAHDWSRTPLGPRASWPKTLEGYVRMILMLPTPAIVFWGPEQVQLYNDGYAVIMGPRHPRHLGSTYRECWPDTYPTIYPWMERVLQGEIVEVKRTLIPVTRHGFNEEAVFTFTFSPLRDDEGKIGGFLQIVNEVTEAVLAERRENTLRGLAPVIDSPAPVVETQRIVGALAQNPHDVPCAFLFLFPDGGGALQPSASVGFGADGPSAAELKEAQRLAEEVLQREGPVELEGWARVSAGRAVAPWPEPVDTVVALPVRRTDSERPRGVVVLGASPRLRFEERYREFFKRVAREIAHHLAVHQELAVAEQLKLALDSARLGTWLVDLKAHRVRLSSRTAAFLGVEREEDQELAFGEVDRIHPEDRGRFDAAWRAAVVNKELFSCEYRILRPDGQLRWLRSWGRASFDRDGAPLALSGVSLDISDMKRAAEVLEEAVRARDEFMSIASHELKTPLTSLLLHVQGQRRALQRAGPIPDTVAALIRQTEKQAERLSRLVNDMLDVARIDSGKLEVVRARTELSRLVAESVERLQAWFETKGIPLELRPGPAVYAEVDPDRLEQVVTNLLTNALRYGDKKPVVVELQETAGHARLAVHDQGRGLSPESQARVFGRFERDVSANEVSGLGLGLFIAKEIVERHGGRIWVESEPGRGSTFFVEVPLSPRP